MKKLFAFLPVLLILVGPGGCVPPKNPQKDIQVLQDTIGHATSSNHATQSQLVLAADATKRAATRPAVLTEVGNHISNAQHYADETDKHLVAATTQAVVVSDDIDDQTNQIGALKARNEKLERSWFSPNMTKAAWTLGIVTAIGLGIWLWTSKFRAVAPLLNLLKRS